MAIGRLASLKTSLTTGGVNKNTELYSFSGILSKVTIHVTNQSLETSKVFVGIASGSLNNISRADYLIYNKKIDRNQSFVIDNVGIKSGDILFCKSSEPDVGFVVQSTFDYNNVYNNNFSTGITTFYGKEFAGITTETGFVINKNFSLFRSNKNSVITLRVINQNVSDDCKFFIGISSSGVSEFSSNDFIVYNQKLNPREEYVLENIGIGVSQTLVVKANKTDVSFIAYSVPANQYEGLINFDTVGISTQWRTALSGINTSVNVGIGTTLPTTKLDVVGNSRFSGISTFNNLVVVGGSTTSLIVTGDARITGVLTGNVTGNVTGNINAITGISTLNSLKVGLSTTNTVTIGSGSTAIIATGNVNVSGTTSTTNLYVSGSLSGPGVDAAILAFSVIFGS